MNSKSMGKVYDTIPILLYETKSNGLKSCCSMTCPEIINEILDLTWNKRRGCD